MRILAKPGLEIGELNPYTRALYEHIQDLNHFVDEFNFRRALIEKYDIVHFHWPEYFVANPSWMKAVLGSLGILAAASWARARGSKVVWTAHNLKSHNQARPRAEKWFWRAFCNSLDGFIALSQSGRDDARRRHPALSKIPGFVTPHGHYRDEYPDCVSRNAARQSLRISHDARVICFFGTISPYKGVPKLVDAFRRTVEPGLVLLIAGANDCAADVEFCLAQAAQDSRIRFHLRFVPKEEVQFFMRAADLVVLPFREVWNSGTALLALSFDLPVLVPDCGTFAELQRQAGADWVRLYRGELAEREITEAVRWATRPGRSNRANLKEFEWDRIAEQTVRAYQDLTRASSPELVAAVRNVARREEIHVGTATRD